MSIVKYIDRLVTIDYYVSRKATGTPAEFSEKLGISRSKLLKEIKELKAMGAPIAYNNCLKTYFYSDSKKLILKFE
ncbi:HTH domain-containing protein [Pedobacter sp. WC2423]|uniref:HTH domain-containing protein n=1 Tax=Pedobacter sp. WC2423 TaxID=3234142 RepID=UPI0034664FBD